MISRLGLASARSRLPEARVRVRVLVRARARARARRVRVEVGVAGGVTTEGRHYRGRATTRVPRASLLRASLLRASHTMEGVTH